MGAILIIPAFGFTAIHDPIQYAALASATVAAFLGLFGSLLAVAIGGWMVSRH